MQLGTVNPHPMRKPGSSSYPIKNKRYVRPFNTKTKEITWISGIMSYLQGRLYKIHSSWEYEFRILISCTFDSDDALENYRTDCMRSPWEDAQESEICAMYRSLESERPTMKDYPTLRIRWSLKKILQDHNDYRFGLCAKKDTPTRWGYT